MGRCRGGCAGDKAMTKAAVVSIVFLSVTVALAQPGQSPQGAWLQDGIKWSKAPKEINPKLSSGRAAIAYFGRDHKFSLIYATVNRVQREYEIICNGCGQVVYLGSWELAEKTIKVKYRLVSRTVQIIGEQLPGPVQEDSAKIEGDAVVFLGHSFHRSTALEANVKEFVPPVPH
jgi:hypothetical protein